jgi:hypothetical protein
MTSAKGRPLLKLGRARRALDELREAVDGYRYGNNFHVHQVPDPAAGGIDLILRVTTPPPLDEWALVFGDGVHNVRAALDHLAWQLDPQPDRSTTFPIYAAKPKNWPPTAVAKMPKAVQHILESLQPYHETAAGRDVDLHPLNTANVLDIRDKHRTLIVAIGALAGDIISGLPLGATSVSGLWQEFRDGAQVNSVYLPAGASAPGLSCTPSFDAVLAERPWIDASLLYVLEKVLIEWVEEQVMKPLLPHARP